MDSKAHQAEEEKQKEIFQAINGEKSQSLQRKLLAVQKLNTERTNFQENTYENDYLNLKRQFDLDYEKVYNEISGLLKGTITPSISEEEQKKYNLTNQQDGGDFADYWLQVLKSASSNVGLNENDEKILKHLLEVRLTNKEDRLSYTIELVFSANEYFPHDIISKSYFYDIKDHQLCRTEATQIQWKSEDLIPNKIKKTKTVKSNYF